VAEISDLQLKISQVQEEVAKIVVGQKYMIDRLLIGLFTGGHILLEGVPGLAKTLTVNTLSKVVDLEFKRIQFTPDLLPSDLIGTLIFNPKVGEFQVKKGPVFSNIILADEINRTPAKVQSALLEAMQEKQVTIGEETYKLDKPFLVLATQNPVEQEGTYPLPEAQVDRFMLKVNISYLSKEEELEVMKRMSNLDEPYECKKILSKQDIFDVANTINKIQISDSLEKYIIELVFATRNPKDYGLKEESEYISYGVSPRASINLNRAAKCVALMNGRDFVLPDDIKEIASDVLSHRIILNYEAEADGITSRQIVESILKKVPITK
jgi:MoxR-like ATPase